LGRSAVYYDTQNIAQSPRPRRESLMAAAVQWAERIMRKVDICYGTADATIRPYVTEYPT
jgi:hypothetical protein